MRPGRHAFGSLRMGGSPARLDIVISKKTVSSAVSRNRIRRRVRHAIHSLIGDPPTRIVVRPLPAAGRMPYLELCRELAEALKAR